MELIKKAACILFAAMVSTTFVKAQDLCVEPGTWSLEAGIAPTSLAGTYSTTEQVFRPFGEIFAVIFTFGLYTPQQSYDKYYTSPGLSLRGGYQINKWLMVTTDLNYGTARAERIKTIGRRLPSSLECISRTTTKRSGSSTPDSRQEPLTSTAMTMIRPASLSRSYLSDCGSARKSTARPSLTGERNSGPLSGAE